VEKFFKTSTVYAYHVPELNAVKVGFGDNPHARMTHYCKIHDLAANPASIKSWKIPATSIASALESAIHKGLEDAGISKIDYASSNGRAVELFSLEGISYNDAILYVADLLDTITGKLINQLGGNLADFERRQLAELKSRQTRERLREQKVEQERAKQAEIKIEWESGWNEFIRPWCELTSRCKNIRQSYKPPGMLYKLKHGDDCIPHYVKWHDYVELLALLPSYFFASRKARGFRVTMNEKYGYRNNPSGWDMYQPCEKKPTGYHRTRQGSPHLWFLNYMDKDDPNWIYDEIGMAASCVFGLAKEKSLDLLKREEPEMLELLILLAKETPPPEFLRR